MISLLLGVASGFGFPLQTCVNTRLRQRAGSPLVAAFISFAISLLFLLCLIPVFGDDISLPLGQIVAEPLWIWAGGLCGVTVIAGNILLFPRIGSMQTVILPILGQILMGLAIDHFGLFHAPELPLSALRLLGAGLVFAGVVAVSTGRQAQGAQPDTVPLVKNLWLWRLFGVFVGTLTSLQTAVNSYLGLVVHSPVKASVVSFLTGLGALLALCLLERLARQRTHSEDSGKDAPLRYPWWIWTGGFFGAAMVLINVYLGQLIGTGLTVIMVLTGSMLGGLIVDQFALLGAAHKPIRIPAVLGMCVILAGIGMIRL